MKRINGRLFVLACAFVLLIALAERPRAEEDAIPTLRDSDGLLKYYRGLPMIDVVPWPFSYLDSAYPFKAIHIGVTSMGPEQISRSDLDVLTKFARRAMRARLEELEVSDRIQVSETYPSLHGRPLGLTRCEVLNVSFRITVVRQNVEGLNIEAGAISLLGWQDSADRQAENPELACRPGDGRPPWVFYGVRRPFVMKNEQAAIFQQGRAAILDFMNHELLRAVTTTNETARAAFDELLSESD